MMRVSNGRARLLHGISAASLAAVLWAAAAPMARAQGGPAEAAAVAGVILQAVGGLSSWIDKNSDDCAAAAMGAAWGKDCNLTKEEKTDTGMFYASCIAIGDNSCARGAAGAYADESTFGMWAGYTTSPWAVAFTKALHGNDDKHGASAWAKAQVDGTGVAKTDETPALTRPEPSRDLVVDRRPTEITPRFRLAGHDPAAPAGPGSPRDPDRALRRNAATDWPEGTVLAVAFFDSLRISAVGGSPRASSVRARFDVSDLFSWEGYLEVDGFGSVTSNGGFPASAYSVGFDSGAGRWTLQLVDFRIEFPVDTLVVSIAEDSVVVPMHLDVELQADAEAAGAFEPEAVPVTPYDLHQTDADGVPIWNGRLVQVVTPIVAVAGSSPFGPYLDTNVTDGGVGLGVLDLFGPADWQEGDLMQVAGYVTHHEGRTILTDLRSQLIATGQPVPPPLDMPVQMAVENGEQFEGMRVRFHELTLVEPSQWPESPKEIGLVRVEDPSGAQIDLEVLAPPERIEGFAPMGPFQATGVLVQRDPDGAPYFEGYRLRLESIEEPAPSEVSEGPAAAPFSMRTFPNPAAAQVAVTYRLADRGRATVTVLDAQGRLVRTLAAAELPPGLHTTDWDARNERGEAVSSGVYFVRVAAEGRQETRKLTITR